MQDHPIVRRLEVLEDALFGPDGVANQIAIVRTELHDVRQEQAAIRVELHELRERMATRADLDELRQTMATRVELGALRQEMYGEFAAVRHDMQDLKTAIEQTNAHMRVLHEEVVERISRIGTGGSSLSGGATVRQSSRRPRGKR